MEKNEKIYTKVKFERINDFKNEFEKIAKEELRILEMETNEYNPSKITVIGSELAILRLYVAYAIPFSENATRCRINKTANIPGKWYFVLDTNLIFEK
jgi:hypothetical protein